MTEFKAAILLADLFPKPPDFEVGVSCIGIVDEHYTTGPDLRIPSFEIMFHCFVGMETIDVQQIDGFGAELFAGVIKRIPEQSRKTSVVRRVVSLDLLKHGLVVVPRV